MNAQDHLRQTIADHEHQLVANIPSNHQAAIVSLIRAQDRSTRRTDSLPVFDLVTGHHLTNLGGNKALHLCFLRIDDDLAVEPSPSNRDLDAWAEHFLEACRRLAEVELVLAHCETGFMRLVNHDDEMFHAWIATKRLPTSWRERADIDWWASSLARQHEAEGVRDDSDDRRLGTSLLKTMSYQLGYPPDAVIGACTVQTYLDILGLLIGWALRARDQGEPPEIQSEHELVIRIASELAIDPFVVGDALSTLTVDRESAPYHAAVAGVAAAPLVLVAPDRIVCSLHGLTTEPLLFLMRELRRRNAEAYHNTAFLREAVFRNDLYALFADKRFVTSASRIELRRKVGDVRTDIDAVVFDRKTGTIGLFELKSQDPFARSTAELTRQRDNILYANRQISGTLDWIKHHGGNEILHRIDPRTAKTFRVQKVFPFVLGRYLAHFNDGPAPDHRAAWATWPQLLRSLGDKPIRPTDSNPIASLFTRLSKDESPIIVPAASPSRDISLGPTRVTVHASYADYQAGGVS